MNNEIMKPTSIVRAEFIEAITNLINNSNLPPFVIEPIIKDIYSDICLIARKQLEQDKTKYQEALTHADGQKQG